MSRVARPPIKPVAMLLPRNGEAMKITPPISGRCRKKSSWRKYSREPLPGGPVNCGFLCQTSPYRAVTQPPKLSAVLKAVTSTRIRAVSVGGEVAQIATLAHDRLIRDDQSCARFDFVRQLLSKLGVKLNSRSQSFGVDSAAFATHAHPPTGFASR